MDSNFGQAVWVAIIFLIVLAILYPTAWKNILEGLKAREARIRGDIAAAEAARLKAEATLKEYAAQLATAEGKVREMLATATADAEKAAVLERAQPVAAALRARGLAVARDRLAARAWTHPRWRWGGGEPAQQGAGRVHRLHAGRGRGVLGFRQSPSFREIE